MSDPEPTQLPTDHPDTSRQAPHRDTESHASEAIDASHGTLDLDGAIAFLRREHLSDETIGYSVRRIAREGSPEQVAAFMAVHLDLLRRSGSAHGNARSATPS